jgi:hypothetical protein
MDPSVKSVYYISNIWEMYRNHEISSASLKYYLLPTSVQRAELPKPNMEYKAKMEKCLLNLNKQRKS